MCRANKSLTAHFLLLPERHDMLHRENAAARLLQRISDKENAFIVERLKLTPISFAKAIAGFAENRRALRMGDNETGGGGDWSGNEDHADSADSDDHAAGPHKPNRNVTTAFSGGFFQDILQGIINRIISFVIGVLLLGSCCCCAIFGGYFFGNPAYVGSWEHTLADGKALKLILEKDKGAYTGESGKIATFQLEKDKDKNSLKLTMHNNADTFWTGKSSGDFNYTIVGDTLSLSPGKNGEGAINFTKINLNPAANTKKGDGNVKPANAAKKAGDDADKKATDTGAKPADANKLDADQKDKK
jgi:hypothetical protein